MTANLIGHFASVADPRVERNKFHALIDIIVLSVCAVASGAEGWEAIEQFGKEKLEWLRKFIALENGVPSHDGIADVLCRVSPPKFRECFRSWAQAVTKDTGGRSDCHRCKIAKGSRARKRSPLHRVSAWACHNRRVLGQEATQEKSNEITAIPKLLGLLELKGCIVTLDAMGCQRAIAKQAIDQGGNYVLGLKGNQGALQEAVEKDHGRLESRRYWLTEALRTLPDTENWEGLRSIGMVQRECLQGVTPTVEQRYFINSIPAQAKPFAVAVRGHWGVESAPQAHRREVYEELTKCA